MQRQEIAQRSSKPASISHQETDPNQQRLDPKPSSLAPPRRRRKGMKSSCCFRSSSQSSLLEGGSPDPASSAKIHHGRQAGEAARGHQRPPTLRHSAKRPAGKLDLLLLLPLLSTEEIRQPNPSLLQPAAPTEEEGPGPGGCWRLSKKGGGERRRIALRFLL